jgi:iron complex transport system substrate-binding protein
MNRRSAALRLALKAVVACYALVATLGASAAPLLHDDRGAPVTLAAVPARIVTLLPSLTESVCALDDCAKLVGVDRYSNWPASVNALPHLGGQDDAQIERIVALKPDLVLASASSRVVSRLESLGVHVLALEAKSTADIHRVLETIAQALGKPGAGDAQWARIQVRVAHAAARVPAGWHARRAYFEISSAPYAAGASSFIGETLAQLGVGNIVPASMGPFPKLNPEYVVRAQPDLVMAETRALDEMPNRPGWNRLHALEQGRHCGFASEQYDVLVRPGPRLGEAAELMADCLGRVAPPPP